MQCPWRSARPLGALQDVEAEQDTHLMLALSATSVLKEVLYTLGYTTDTKHKTQ